MTVTKTTSNRSGSRPEYNYEVELEISDIKFLMGLVNDEIAFRSVIRRFL